MRNSASRQLVLQFSMARDRFDIEMDLTLDLSEPVAIFGASGSGKTSILRAISGLERASHGRILLDDEPWQRDEVFVPTYRRRVGYVFQDARLFPHLDVNANLELASRAAGSEARLSRRDIVDRLNLGNLLGRDTHSLSGGETQRVAIARTLLAQPRVLLMDEPVSSLDAQNRRETIEYIASITQTWNLPLLYVTHDAGEVARLAGTTVLLEQGKVAAAGPTPEVFARIEQDPSGARAVSILAATLSGETGGLSQLSIGQQHVRLPMPGRSRGERVQLRIFATDVVIATRRIDDTSIRNVLIGTVQEIRTFSEGTAEIRIDIENQLLKAHVTVDALEDLGLAAGSTAYAMIKSVALGDSSREPTL